MAPCNDSLPIDIAQYYCSGNAGETIYRLTKGYIL